MLNKVTVDAILSLARELGCTVNELKSYYQLTAPEPNRKAVYVGKAKRFVTRIDASGFTPEPHPSITILTDQDAKDLKLGAVRGQILTKDSPEDMDVLEGVRAMVRGLLSSETGKKLSRGQKPEETEETQSEEAETIAS